MNFDPNMLDQPGEFTPIPRTVPSCTLCLTLGSKPVMLEGVDDRGAIRQDYAVYRAAVRAARMPNPVLAASIDRILADKPHVEPVIVCALEGYPYFD